MKKTKLLKPKTVRYRMHLIEQAIAVIIQETKKKTEKLDKKVLEIQARCPHNDVILAGPDFSPTFEECMFPVAIGNYYCKDCGLESIEKFGVDL